MSTGITENKNSLGVDLLILGYFFLWHWLQTWKAEKSKARRNELWLIAGFLIGIWWLFSQARSATPFLSLWIGGLALVFVGIRSVNKNRIGTYVLTALVLVAAAELVFGISAGVSAALGRGSHLSGRTPLWTALLAIDINPILGTGFESFWLGEKPNQLAGLFWFIPNQAHNGYLEIYLTLGVIGLFILMALFIDTFLKIRRQLFRDFEWGRYRLGFLLAIVVYNWTEAGFKTIAPMSFVFYLIAMEYPKPYLITAQPLARSPMIGKVRREAVYAEEKS